MRYFDMSEYRCRCHRPECDAPQELSPVMAQRLDALRESLNQPLILTSGLRCRYWNAQVGGAPDSRHLTGQAVDVACEADGARYTLLQHALLRPTCWFPFIELAPKHVHLDVSERTLPLLMLGSG